MMLISAIWIEIVLISRNHIISYDGFAAKTSHGATHMVYAGCAALDAWLVLG
jgi:hypothetical protein